MGKFKVVLSVVAMLILSAVSVFAEQEISWSTQANSLRGQNGLRVDYYCPPGNPVGRLWGSGLYTDDSSICTAAVHAGKISPESGGAVAIEIRPGASSYRGSTHYGVTSGNYGGWHGSFRFVSSSHRGHGRNQPVEQTPEEYGPPQGGYKHGIDGVPGGFVRPPNTGHVHDGYAPPSRRGQQINWATQADSLRGRNGQRVNYYCPAGGSYSGRLWGSNPYTDDSSICLAAVHAGIITPDGGGNVTIEIRPGASSYHGSSRNGVNSNNYGGWHGSFVISR